MKKRILFLLVGVLLIGMIGNAHASLSYQANYLGSAPEGEYWQYNYTIRNGASGGPITEVFIDFQYGLYDLLTVGTKSGWFTQSADPAFAGGTLFNGFYNAQALGSGIAPGGADTGFSVSFLWLDPGVPPADQTYQLISNGVIVESGQTSVVPIPGTLLLLGSGLGGIIALKRRFGIY